MKIAKKINIHRFDIEHSLKELPEHESIFPYRFRWRASGGKRVKEVDVVCSKDRAIWVDIEYTDDEKETIKI